MKNLKNMLVASGLMVVFMIGASTVNAGVIVIMRADEEAAQTTQCTEDTTGFFQTIKGIILTDLKGLLVGDAVEQETACKTEQSRNGLLVSD